MTTPDTVTEAVELLATQGYVDDYRLCDAGIVAGAAPMMFVWWK